MVEIQAGRVEVKKPDLWWTLAEEIRRNIGRPSGTVWAVLQFPLLGSSVPALCTTNNLYIIGGDGVYRLYATWSMSDNGGYINMELRRFDGTSEDTVASETVYCTVGPYFNAYVWFVTDNGPGIAYKVTCNNSDYSQTETHGQSPLPSSLDWFYNWRFTDGTTQGYIQPSKPGFVYNNFVIGVNCSSASYTGLYGDPGVGFFKCDDTGYCYNVRCIDTYWGRYCIPDYIAERTEWPEPPSPDVYGYQGRAGYPSTPPPYFPTRDGYAARLDSSNVLVEYGSEYAVVLGIWQGVYVLYATDFKTSFRLEYDSVGPVPPLLPDGSEVIESGSLVTFNMKWLEFTDEYVLPPPVSSIMPLAPQS